MLSGVDTLQDRAELTRLHVNIALSVYLLLFARLIWRLISAQPRWAEQGRLDRLASRSAHGVMMLAIVVMLVSGPIIMLGTATPIDLFGTEQPTWQALVGSPVVAIAHRAHSIAANALMIVASVHALGACKHLMFDDDDVFLRMLVPRRR